jgi:tRNA A37 threonylcarbamoyladenosine synthetase subunit TsaC/SUA5/YrdC
MQISFNQPISIKQVSDLYTKNSPLSFTSTRASDALSSLTDAEMIHDLKKALILAIDGGNYEKALFILMRLKEMGFLK